MKRMMKLMLGSLLLIGSPAMAQTNPNLIDTVRQQPTALTGSDTLNKIMDDLIAGLGAQLQGGITTYQGLGSSQGERQLAGSPNAGEPTCTPNDGNGAPEGNPGCQEIAPMSRELQSGICDDDPNFPGTANTQAEGLAFCADGLVVVTDNESIAFGAPAACAAYDKTSTPNTGNTFPDRGVGALKDWKSTLRLLYTGCGPTGACATIDRQTRCNSDARKALVANWASLFDGQACATGLCPQGLRHAYRRDDASGTTGVFLALIGVEANVNVNLLGRAAMITATGSFVPFPVNLSFCDGGQNEGLLPTGGVAGGAPSFDGGDPIRTTCAPEDDLCALDGKLGVVRAIRSVEGAANAFPTHQCQRRFAYAPYLSTALPVCPGNTKPSAGRCLFPIFESGTFRTFNCATSQRQCPAAAPAGTDCRNYNALIHEPTTGAVSFIGARWPLVASWRQNFANLNNSPTFTTGKEFVAADFVCTQADATRTIGCLTANTKCTLGFAGREAAFNTGEDVHLKNEALKLANLTPANVNIEAGTYPLSRLLWVNASRGFENIMEDCKNRGGSKTYCEAQVRIAQEFYNMGQPGNLLANICSNAGYVPLTAAVCKGAQASTATATTAGCGAPTTQTLADCAIDARSYDSLANND